MRTPRLYLGTMTFSWSQSSSKVDEPVALEMVRKFKLFNEENNVSHHLIDTARIYAGGKTEPTVGSVLSKQEEVKPNAFLVGSKAHPSQAGGLSAEGIEQQLQASLKGLGMASLHEYYLHQPDTEHSLLDSLKYLHEQVKQGRIEKVGMSNYHASEMKRAFALCAEHGLTPPTVYQGLYNPLNRLVEEELLGVLRENKCSFVAYNPLAAGLLSGKHTSPDEAMKGRFKNNQNYLPRFYTKANFEALATIRKACDEAGISLIEATFRWLLRHSALTTDDGVLLGASSVQQLDQNLASCMSANKGDLPLEVLDAFEAGWNTTCAAGVFPYWRSYSGDMPNREALDQGASYSAAKK